MKTEFQAKDIQKILNIKKHRYEYIASKIGIKPEIEDVEGTGYTHKYSYKNLLQFAFVNQANKMGLSPKASLKMLSEIEEFEKTENFGIFKPKKLDDASIHYINCGYYNIFIISDSLKILRYQLPIDEIKRLSTPPTLKFQKDEYEIARKFLLERVETADKEKKRNMVWYYKCAPGMVTINLGSIKKEINYVIEEIF